MRDSLSAVVTRKASDVETVKLVDAVKTSFGLPNKKKPLHFRDLKHERRVPFVDRIGHADLRTVTVLIHKPSINEPEMFGARNILYFHTARLLFERVSWYCREHKSPHDAGDGSADMIFSTRSSVSYEEIRQYLRVLIAKPDVRIDWNVIRPDQIEAYSPGRRMGLQIADAVAGSFYYAVQPTQYGYTEDRYVRLLKPAVYRRKGQYMGYGVKFWPAEVSALFNSEARFE